MLRVAMLLPFGKVCYTQNRTVALSSLLRHQPNPRLMRIMLRRFIAVSVLLLVASVQALAANCELRCTMMAMSNQACGSHSLAESKSEHAMHCHGMSMGSEKGDHAVSADGHCKVSVCKVRLEALAKQSLTTESLSRSSTSPGSAQLLSGPSAVASIQLSLSRSFRLQGGRSPLDVRPGASLRI
jgi:hypothetical protein